MKKIVHTPNGPCRVTRGQDGWDSAVARGFYLASLQPRGCESYMESGWPGPRHCQPSMQRKIPPIKELGTQEPGQLLYSSEETPFFLIY